MKSGDADTIASAASVLDAAGTGTQSASGLMESLRSKEADVKSRRPN